MMQKRKDCAFGKNVYLLGENEYGEQVWLEAPSWDCGWYWGFGYVEVYAGRGGVGRVSPSKASDINSHSHFDGLLWFTEENGSYVHHLNASPKMKETVLTDEESWELADLMKSFYTLKKTAEFFHQGNSHVSSTGVSLKNPEIEKYVNEVAIPAITARVLEILSPAVEQTAAA
jgi:hypothetical protein